MAVPRLAEAVTVWRIGDPKGRFPIFSGDGAALCEGHWHRKGQDVIYTSEHFGTAMLEKLVHYNGVLSPNQHFITVEIPAGVSYEAITKDRLPEWDAADGFASRQFGATWFDEARTAILFVPSVVSREENDVLINPNHADSERIHAQRELPVRWDQRLFSD